MSDRPRIAFLGLGHMGGPMVVNLHKAGFGVAAYDLSAEALAAIQVLGVPVAASAREAVAGAQVNRPGF